MSTDATSKAQQQVRSRPELARHLLDRLDQLESQLGTIPLATQIQLLKRDLSRAHDFLRPAGETNFLSVVVLAEAALAGLTWKLYTPEIVDALRRAFTAGTRPETLTFEDYAAIRRMFRERGISIVPTIDLEALTAEDLDDGQDG